uniref:Uncharacterized protein n=1 Tax=Arundo donax TaxID=35708 RepID=A0A0A9GA43_ARUDO
MLPIGFRKDFGLLSPSSDISTSMAEAELEVAAAGRELPES